MFRGRRLNMVAWSGRRLVQQVAAMRCASTARKEVGFVGIGLMGSAMASNLIERGHTLHVYDVSRQACDILKSKGAHVCEDTGQVAQASDYVITMLPNNDIVAKVYDEMVDSGIKTDTMFIDSSTIDPGLAKQLQRTIAGQGARFVDAPVSGGVPGAQQATLTFMVGGTKDEYEHVKELLAGMGKRITHCGAYGMGQAAKLCNNMMLGVSMIGVAEAMNLAIRLGLDAKTFADIINSSTGRCWVTETYSPVPGITPTAPASHQYADGFSTDLITKDLGLVSGVAANSNTPIPLGAMAHQIYRMLKSHGLGSKDFSIIYDFLQNTKHN